MTARYIRTSHLSQSNERQILKKNDGEKIYIDKVSGIIPFEERTQAKELLKDIKEGKISYLTVDSICRLGRNTLNVLSTISELHRLGVTIKVENLGLESMMNGKESPTFKLISSVMANLAEMERSTLRERQLEGIAIRKAKKLYTGREKGTTESKDEVLAKYPKVIFYLKKSNPPTLEEIGVLCGCSKNTVQKVKKLYFDKEVVNC
jgi:DNA invertase Pin-like site-specific DNA recombinase